MPDYETHDRLVAASEGGPQLIALHGRVPTFHDASVTEISFGKVGMVKLRHWRGYEASLSQEQPYDAIIRLHDVLDLELNQFVHGSILFWLLLQPPVSRPERAGHFDHPSLDDVELDFEATLGVGGFIRCRRVSFEFRPIRSRKVGQSARL